MNLDGLKSRLHQNANAIDLCFKAELISPALILLYAGIDVASSLDVECKPMKRVKERYTHWCKQYLLRAKPLPCTEQDLYAARCGLVHGLTAESDLSKTNRARMIIYAWGRGKVVHLENAMRQGVIKNSVALQVEDLILANQLGLELFFDALEKDPAKSGYALNVAQKILANVPA